MYDPRRIRLRHSGDISTAITISAPSGWAFSVVAPTAATPIPPGNIVLGSVTVFPLQITVPVVTPSTMPGPIEITNIRMQPTGCTPPGLHNVPVTTDAGGAGDLSGATLITITLLAGPTVARYTLASDSPEIAGTPITATLSALDGCGNRIPNAVAPRNITLGCQVAGLVIWTTGAPFVLSNVNVVPDTATIAAGSEFDATGRGTFSVTNQQTCAEATTVTATHAGGPATATTPLSISWINSDTDSDGDGVINCLDACASSPACAAVDQTGCPIDGDGDSVADGCDTCPGTLAGDPVGANGCSTADEDGDGVLNDADACRGTPACAIASVGVNGCPADADGDGLFDGCDQCPGANDLTDSDADGVPDCIDGCVNDPLKFDPGASAAERQIRIRMTMACWTATTPAPVRRRARMLMKGAARMTPMPTA